MKQADIVKVAERLNDLDLDDLISIGEGIEALRDA